MGAARKNAALWLRVTAGGKPHGKISETIMDARLNFARLERERDRRMTRESGFRGRI